MSKDLNELLEPLFLNGFTNYSSHENKKTLESIVREQGISPDKVKKWIDNRKQKEKRIALRSAEVDNHHVAVERPDIKDIPSPLHISPLRFDRWKHYLQYCDLEDKQWVLDGIQNGFSLHCESTELISAKRNLQTAYSQPEVINSYFETEIKLGSMSGPYLKLPYTNAHVNRFGIIPKSSGKWRLVTDLSFPAGASVNDGISDENSFIEYTGVGAAVNKVLRLGRGCLLAKFDLKRAYKLLAIREEERRLLVVKWKGLYYVDLCLPFGVRSAPKTFSRFADMLQWILKTYGNISDIQHSSDDFLVCGPADSNICGDSLNRAVELCHDLGVDTGHTKTQGPSTNLLYLGLVIDTDSMELRIPAAKLEKIRLHLEEWIHKKSGTKRSLLSLIGMLSYCSQCVLCGKPFLYRLVEKANSVEYFHDRVTLTESEQSDIEWWYYLFNTWNGRSLLTSLSSDIVTKVHS